MIVVVCLLRVAQAALLEAIVFCGWVPLLNIWYLWKIIRTACHEAAELETGEKFETK